MDTCVDSLGNRYTSLVHSDFFNFLMLNSTHQLQISLQTKHPYEEWIVTLQHKTCAAISVGLLDRLMIFEESLVFEKLNYILNNNSVWNNLKDLNGFKKNEKETTNKLITSTRKLLLYRQLRLSLSHISTSLTGTNFVNRILDKIPENVTSMVLEELLDRFMKDEIQRKSSQKDNPIIKEIEKAEKEAQKDDSKRGKWIIINNRDNFPIDPNSVDEEIQRIQNIKQSRSYPSSPSDQHDEKEGTSTINSELGNYIYSVLKNLHNQTTSSDLLDDYLYKLENDINIGPYINRPDYKLALRVKNILIFSYSSNDQMFSKSGIEDVLKLFNKTFFENLEIYLFLEFIKDSSHANYTHEYIKNIVQKILCKIYYEITAEPLPGSIEIPEGVQHGSDEYLDLLSQFSLNRNLPALTDYAGISLDETIISVKTIYHEVIDLFKKKDNPKKLRDKLIKVFIKSASHIAQSNNIDFNDHKFEARFFGHNSSNIILEFSRRFLACTDIKIRVFNKIIDKIFDGDEYIKDIHSCLHIFFGAAYSWNVYFPIKGISIVENTIDSYFHEFATSLSETHEIKFLSPEMLKTFSLEATSSIEGGPIVFLHEKATACASFEGIQAGDSQQAFKIAMSQLFDAMEAQWYLTQHGHQYKVEPLIENSKIMALCKKVFNDNSLSPDWSLSQISYKRAGVFPYELNQESKKYFAVPARQIKILTQRAAIADSLGEVARNILHCIKLFRKGFFSEDLSERFRLYWAVLDTLFSSDTSSAHTAKALVPYRVSLFRLGVNGLLKPGYILQYKQARLWMREDIEDLYTFVRNPLIHDGVENTVAYERLMNRFESIVSSILRELSITVIYKNWPDRFLDRGMEGIIEYLEIHQPSHGQIQVQTTQNSTSH